MRKKIISIIFCTLFIATIITNAGTVNDPEITDAEGDAFGYLDIDSAWFYEEVESPDFLFVAMKIHEPSHNKFQQTFAVFWKYRDQQYSCGLHLGFGLGDDWESYGAGRYVNRAPGGGPDHVHNISDCSYSSNEGIITWKISKDIIDNPQRDDVLTETCSIAFRRLGFLGRIGFSRPILDSIVFRVFGNSLWDHAPDNYGEFGKEYIIQY